MCFILNKKSLHSYNPLTMNIKYLYSLLFLLFSINLTSQNATSGGTFNGNVQLRSQADVNTFGANNFSNINGFLLIRGDDITTLSPLLNLDTIGHSLIIEFNRSLMTLNGLDNVQLVGGNLHIENNTKLDSIGTFQQLQMVKGPLVLRRNPRLRECCAMFPIVSGQQGTIVGMKFISENKEGCSTEKDLLESCDDDTDNDGTDDSLDACPNDPQKINPGFCGCGVADTDSDNDGTPDCNDECPNDPNKTKEGACGCNRSEVDSDNDGTPDCIDDCPSNPSITTAGICGCSNPKILSLDIDNIGSCADNSTPSNFDDTFTADLTITFEGVPTTGTLLITGDANTAIHFTEANTSKIYTLFGLQLKADGELIEIIATFDGNDKCTLRRVFGIFAPKSCSSGECTPPANVKTDTETNANTATISWSSLGAGTQYELEYRTLNSGPYQQLTTTSTSVLIDNLLDFTEYEYRLRAFCDGQRFSDYTTGRFTSGGKTCSLILANVQNINCHDNQSPEDISDDYITFDLYVEGTNTDSTFMLTNVAGDNIGRYDRINTFRTANGILGNGDIDITIRDNTDENCTIATTVTDPGVCTNDCALHYITIDTVLKCWDRGTRWKLSDDFFTADLTVHFSNPPTNGTLDLMGNIRGSVPTDLLQNRNSYTFQGVAVPATGKNFFIGATFSNGIGCTYSIEVPGIEIRDDNICKDQCNILNVQTLSVQCADNNTPDDSADDYLIFELLVTGINLNGSYHVSDVAGSSIGTYNQPSFFRTNGGFTATHIDLDITDSEDALCQSSIRINNPCAPEEAPLLPHIFNDLPTDGKLQIFPNPVGDELTIQYTPTSNQVQLTVFDLLGKRVISQTLSDNRLSLHQLNQGVYHLVIQDGNKLLTEKFIKK